jgi:hypothetical protein
VLALLVLRGRDAQAHALPQRAAEEHVPNAKLMPGARDSRARKVSPGGAARAFAAARGPVGQPEARWQVLLARTSPGRHALEAPFYRRGIRALYESPTIRPKGHNLGKVVDAGQIIGRWDHASPCRTAQPTNP